MVEGCRNLYPSTAMAQGEHERRATSSPVNAFDERSDRASTAAIEAKTTPRKITTATTIDAMKVSGLPAQGDKA